MDDPQILVMLGNHEGRLAAIERTTTDTGKDVRTILSRLDTQAGARAARAPVGTWVARTTSSIAAAVLGAILALRFGLHK